MENLCDLVELMKENEEEDSKFALERISSALIQAKADYDQLCYEFGKTQEANKQHDEYFRDKIASWLTGIAVYQHTKVDLYLNEVYVDMDIEFKKFYNEVV